MFQKAVLKMTLTYLLILMTISLFFSVALYQISTQEIQKNLKKQQGNFEKFGPFMHELMEDPSLREQREQALSDANRRIVIQLVYTNLVILLIGGGLSYLMALRTLKPIEESHEAQLRFTGDASHELRSPLAAMKSEIEVALRDPKLTREEAIGILKSNLEEVERLGSLSTYLLELAKDDGAGLELGTVKVERAVAEAIGVVMPRAKQSKIKITSEVPEDLRAIANRESLKEVLVILLENAVKYSTNGKTVTVSGAQKGRTVSISVTDQGIGISPEDLPHIFERFYRADSSRCKNKVEGYGLGLALAQKLAHANRGEITVKSKVGEGSVFTLRLNG